MNLWCDAKSAARASGSPDAVDMRLAVRVYRLIFHIVDRYGPPTEDHPDANNVLTADEFGRRPRGVRSAIALTRALTCSHAGEHT